jgi:hypothetical protein
MNQPKELEWTRMFAFDLPAVRPAKTPHECSAACQEAREIKCTCTCEGRNHGSALKKNVKRLDDALGLGKADTETLASQPQVLRLDPQVSRELIYIG